MRKIYYILFILVVCTTDGIAQQLPFSNQYSFNTFTLSPLYAGMNGRSDVSASYCQELVGISGSPIDKTIALNTAIGKNQGLGINLIADQTGVFRNNVSIANYVYHLPVSSESSISFGMNAGMFNNYIDVSSIDATTATGVLQAQRG